MRLRHFPPLLLAILLGGTQLRAQVTPAAFATKLPDSLVFVSATATNHATVVWHPVRQRYYSLRIGSTAFPLETWLPTGGLSIAQTTCGIDSRGLWYNPGTGQVERNCLNALGWATVDIDASSNALSTYTQLFTGMNQPNGQSIGSYDPVLDQVVFYNAGNAYFYARATGLLVQTLPLTGATFTNVTLYSVGWTGRAGYEILLVDYVTKQALLFNRATGAFSGMSQLPAATATHSQFRFSYTNNRLWFFNSTLRKWNAYCIWEQACNATLPVELLHVNAMCSGEAVEVQWATGSERNSSHFEVERSTDTGTWETIGRVEAANSSVQRLDYSYHDAAPPHTATLYYRLRQVDRDGTYERFGPVAVEPCHRTKATLIAYPNPSTGSVNMRLVVPTDEPHTLELHDVAGRLAHAEAALPVGGTLVHTLQLHALGTGAYTLTVRRRDGAALAQTTVVKVP